MNWLPVVGYEGIYEVSDSGLVRKVSGEMCGQWAKAGYMNVRLSRPRAMLLVHRLVASAFHANPKSLPCVNHIDFNTANNCAENLEWCTQKENLAHSQAHGRMPRSHWKGKRAPRAALSEKQAANIRKEYSLGIGSHDALALKYGTSKKTIWRIVNMKSYKPLVSEAEATP